MNITTLFRMSHPDSLLFNTQGDEIKNTWTIKALFQAAASLGAGLIHNGIRPGNRVLILTANCAETYIFSLALWKVGAVAVPVNPALGKDLLAAIIHEMAPSACFHDNCLSAEAAANLSTCCKLFVSLNSSGLISTATSLTYQHLLQQRNGLAEAGDFPPNHPALIIHSSGSQGRPKQIQLGHQQLFNYFHYHDLIHRQFAEQPALHTPQQAFISVFHPCHLAAYSMALQGLLMRRPTYLMQGFAPASYLSLLSRLKCRLSVLVPSMYAALLHEKSVLKEYDFSHLRLCGLVGEPAPETLIQQVEQTFQATVFVGYGLTECLPGIAHTWKSLQQGHITRGSCGKLLFDEAKLVDQHGQPSNPGELWLRNPTVHRCYLDKGLNAARFTHDGWFKSGDLFQRDASDNFFHKGRIDDMFVSNGKNIYPAEIEFALARHPAVKHVVAVAVSDSRGRCVPAVLIQASRQVEETELMEFFLHNGPLHAIPGCIQISVHLPQLGSGKIDRQACQQQLQKLMSDRDSLTCAPGTAAQSCLCK